MRLESARCCTAAFHRAIGKGGNSIASNDFLSLQESTDEALGFIKNGWIVFDIKITVFAEEHKFNKEISHAPRPPAAVCFPWRNPDPNEMMVVEGPCAFFVRYVF